MIGAYGGLARVLVQEKLRESGERDEPHDWCKLECRKGVRNA